jgi:hypothetical protein
VFINRSKKQYQQTVKGHSNGDDFKLHSCSD